MMLIYDVTGLIRDEINDQSGKYKKYRYCNCIKECNGEKVLQVWMD